jgi:NADH dehydrogenase
MSGPQPVALIVPARKDCGDRTNMAQTLAKTAGVFGGSGFVGRHVVGVLARRGLRVRCAVRRPDLAGHLQPLGAMGQIHPVQANLRYPDSIKAAIDGADYVVNLVGILHETRKQSFSAVHVDGARAVAEAARDCGLDAMVHLSALAAALDSPSDYARTKALGEAAVLDVLPQSVILRPSLIFGPEDAFFNRFADLARFSPALPLIGGGETRFQPVYVEDVAEACARALLGKARPGWIYELGGPDVRTFRELIEFMLEAVQRNRLLVPIPFAMARLNAWFLEFVPGKPLTVDQVRLLRSDTVVSPMARTRKATLEGLGIAPRAMAAIVPAYLEAYRRTGQFAGYAKLGG